MKKENQQSLLLHSLRETRKLPAPLRAVFWKSAALSSLIFVYNSISPLWEKCRTPQRYTRQLEGNSPYQKHSLAEEASLSSVLWNTKVNLVILWEALPQSNWETWLKLKRVTRKSSRLRGTESVLAKPTALLSQPTPSKKKGGSNYTFGSNALEQIL